MSHEYVVVFSIDFTKAFDLVKHHPLSQKLLVLDMPDQIYNWMVDYFKDRGHSTYAADVSSLINASIIQGSVVGPPSYVVAAFDLHPKHKQNAMTKFADDTYLLVGSRSVGTVTDEFVNIRNRAAENNMLIHPSKTKELVVYRGRNRRFPELASPLIAGAERVSSLRVVGVLLNSKLTMTEHITAILSTCSSSTYALRLLRSHGLQPHELHLVARAVTVASILYVAPA